MFFGGFFLHQDAQAARLTCGREAAAPSDGEGGAAASGARRRRRRCCCSDGARLDWVVSLTTGAAARHGVTEVTGLCAH